MNKKKEYELEDDLREEYDLSRLKNPVRGKYYQRYREGYTITVNYKNSTKTVEYLPPQNDPIIGKN